MFAFELKLYIALGLMFAQTRMIYELRWVHLS